VLLKSPEDELLDVAPELLTFLSPPICVDASDFEDEPTLVKKPGNTVRLSWNVGLCDLEVVSGADNFVSTSFWLDDKKLEDVGGGGAVCRIIE